MKGLAPNVSKIFNSVSQLACIKPFVLVGGTALSLQLGTRLSEDLDFMRWKTDKNDRLEIDWPEIKKELETIGRIERVDVLGFDHVLFVVDGVKLSFYAAPRKRISTMHEIVIQNNLKAADVVSIGAMKMEMMSRRCRFRDYYDIYSVLKDGAHFDELITTALLHSGGMLKEKNLLAILSNGERFYKEAKFKQLAPIYNVTAADIQKYIVAEIEKKRNRKTNATIAKQLER